MRSEKRKYVRFIAQKDAYAALGTYFTKVGKLIDISIGGLAFEYIDFTEVASQDSSRVAVHRSFREALLKPSSAPPYPYSGRIAIWVPRFSKTSNVGFSQHFVAVLKEDGKHPFLSRT